MLENRIEIIYFVVFLYGNARTLTNFFMQLQTLLLRKKATVLYIIRDMTHECLYVLYEMS